jgi:hypothetical protein
MNALDLFRVQTPVDGLLPNEAIFNAYLCCGSFSALLTSADRQSTAATLLDLYPEGLTFECLSSYWLIQGGVS